MSDGAGPAWPDSRPEQAWSYVRSWIAADRVWIPPTTERTAEVLAGLIGRHRVTGNLITDAQLAALAIEHGLVLQSAERISGASTLSVGRPSARVTTLSDLRFEVRPVY